MRARKSEMCYLELELNPPKQLTYLEEMCLRHWRQRLSPRPQACLWVNEYKKEYFWHKRGNSLIFLHEKSKMQFFYHTIPRTKNFGR